jgi:SAM-dependent methyltransferase
MSKESVASASEIAQYWQNASQIALDSDGLRPVARDPFLQDLVESAMEKWLPSGGTLFDIGSGDGLSTIRFSRSVGLTFGFDYIADFVRRAGDNARQSGVTIGFEQADVMNLTPVRKRHGQADAVTTIRCLINLASWDNQKRALDEIAGLVKPGGIYMLSEGWEHGWAGLDALRMRCGLTPMPLPPFNLLIDRNALEAHVAPKFEIVEYIPLGLYLLLSRVLQPLYTAPDPPRHKHRINEMSAKLNKLGVGADAFHELDYAGVHVLRRRAT